MDVPQLSIVLDPVSNRKVINEDYRIIRKIGSGQYGKVLLGEVIRNTRPSIDSKTSKTSKTSTNSKKEDSVCINDKYVAIKTINRLDKSKLITKSYLSQTVKIKREIQIMKECSHPNVVKLYQVIDDLKFDKILLILEYCQYGEIDWKRYNHYYEKYKPSKRPLTINKILRDVINGLEYLHSVKKIIHRDLKPSNLLITHDNTIKISDFGVSLILQNNHTDQKELSKTMGTPVFYAPELCQFVNNRLSMIHTSHIVIDERIDIWALGVVLYCLMFNDLPFNGFNEFELFKNIVRDDLKFPKIKHTSKTTDVDIKELNLLKDLIKKILVKDQDTRLTVQQIKLHEFTTFDLGSVERKKFLNFNQGVFKDNSNRERLENSKESGMSKLKRFFRSAPEPEKNETPKISTNLEPVDDLLDSYLDDSSSFASDDGEVISNIDTKNVLNDLQTSANENLTSSSSGDIHHDIPRSASNSTNISEVSGSSRKPRPIPLVLTKSSFTPPIENTNHKDKKDIYNNISTSSLVSPALSVSNSVTSATGSFNVPSTPTNNNTVTIGAPSSAGSNKSVFSPSRRFFSRMKKTKNPEQKPTISSLSSPAKKGKNPAKKITDLMEPPPIFGLNAAYPSGSGKSGDSSLKSPISGPPSIAKSFSDNSASTSRRSSPKSAINSRKNSMSSVGSGYGLMKITSSSSSLNLNAYLTDDNYSIASIQRPVRLTVDSDTDHETTIEEPDDTLIDDSIVRNFTSMNEYLDRLD